MDPNTQGDVQEKFCDQSEIQLQDFIQPEKYTALCDALKALQQDDGWIKLGPANKRQYECLPEDPDKKEGQEKVDIIQKARQFFRSEAFYLVLSNLTGLKLHSLASTPSSSDTDESDNGQDDGPKKKKRKKEENGSKSPFDPCCKLQVIILNELNLMSYFEIMIHFDCRCQSGRLAATRCSAIRTVMTWTRIPAVPWTCGSSCRPKIGNFLTADRSLTSPVEKTKRCNHSIIV